MHGFRIPSSTLRSPRLAAVLGALAVVTGACAPGATPLDPATGVEVQVLRWPTQPVARDGENDTAPVAGAVVVVQRAVGGAAARAVTDSTGTARVPLPPGAYRVSVTTCPGAMSLPREPAEVSVTAGSLAAATLLCDTGIR